jgi:apolipoprotein N-acyltransferase
MTGLWPWCAAAASGALLALCFAPASLGGLAWVAMVPLFAALWFSQEWSRWERFRRFALGGVTGLVFFVGSLHWLWTVTIPGWLVLAAYCSIYPALWAVFTGEVAPRSRAGYEEPGWMLSRPNLWAAALSASAWVGLEWLRGIVFTGFAWNSLGVALHENLPIIQIADVTGVAGISFLLVFVNGIATTTLFRLREEIVRRKMRAHFDFSCAVVLVALCFGYGVRKIFESAPESRPLTFAAVQANIPILEKRDPAFEEEILITHERLSQAALAMKPDLLVWPEAATPHPLFLHQPSWDTVRGIADAFDGDFLLGTVHYEERGDFNSAVLLTGQGQNAQLYHKMHLVPFGEYVPFRESFPVFAWLVGDLVPEDFNFGPSATILEMAAVPVKIGALICFEDTQPYMARMFAARGAQLLVTLTNDGWFLESAGSEQHRANAVIRAVETRLPLLRVANTGVTCLIDPHGREVERLEENNGNTFFAGFLTGTVNVPAKPTPTFYTLNGDLFTHACLGLAALGLLLRIRPPR